MESVTLVVVAVLVLLVLVTLAKTVRIVPQARAGVVERLGRYARTLTPGLTILVPFIDKLRPLIDLREQVVSFPPQPVITADNLVVGIDTVIYFQVTDAKAATYEIANYIQGVEQLTVTTLRNVVGNLNLEETLTSRDHINAALRGVLDEATGKWGIRVNRVEIKAIDPPTSIQDSMEKQMRADREKRATILTAEGFKQSQILTAEGERASSILKAEGDAQAAVLRADGEAQAIQRVFDAIHAGDPDQKLLAYQYLQMLPKIAQGDSNKLWIVPSELGEALKGIGGMLGSGIDDTPTSSSPGLAWRVAARPGARRVLVRQLEHEGDVPVRVVVVPDRAGGGVLAAAGPVGAQVPGRGVDRVGRVLDVGVPVAVPVDGVGREGRRHELHRTLRTGVGRRGVRSVPGLHLADGGQQAPGHPAAGARRLVVEPQVQQRYHRAGPRRGHPLLTRRSDRGVQRVDGRRGALGGLEPAGAGIQLGELGARCGQRLDEVAVAPLDVGGGGGGGVGGPLQCRGAVAQGGDLHLAGHGRRRAGPDQPLHVRRPAQGIGGRAGTEDARHQGRRATGHVERADPAVDGAAVGPGQAGRLVGGLLGADTAADPAREGRQ